MANDENNMTRLSVCIPAYNEETGIVETLRHLRYGIPAAEIIVVDDGCPESGGRYGHLS